MLSSGVYLDPQIVGESKLLEIYNRALEHIRDGKVLMQWSGEGTEASKQFAASPFEIAREARYALKTGWPLKYGRIVTTSRVFFQ